MGDKLLRIVLTISVAGLGVGFLGLVEHSSEACHQRQRQYDGEVVYTNFLGHELGASAAQLAKGQADLRATIGPRPSC